MSCGPRATTGRRPQAGAVGRARGGHRRRGARAPPPARTPTTVCPPRAHLSPGVGAAHGRPRAGRTRLHHRRPRGRHRVAGNRRRRDGRGRRRPPLADQRRRRQRRPRAPARARPRGARRRRRPRHHQRGAALGRRVRRASPPSSRSTGSAPTGCTSATSSTSRPSTASTWSPRRVHSPIGCAYGPDVPLVVGVPRELKDGEHRVAITPDGVHELAVHGASVVDRARRRCGIVDHRRRLPRRRAPRSRRPPTTCGPAPSWCMKVKEPQPEELDLLRPGLVLFTYLHLAAYPKVGRRPARAPRHRSRLRDRAGELGTRCRCSRR